MAEKNLKIAWDATIPSSYDQFSDVTRTVGGGQAKTAASVSPDRLVDSARTIQGSLGRAPAEGTTNVPDDVQGIFQR